MFPIRDHNPSGRTPYVTYALLMSNILIFLGYYRLFGDPYALNEFFMTWGIVPATVWDQPLTIVTSTFLHGGIMHLLGNMLFLWVFGDNLEDQLGHGPFALFYLAGGIVAGLVQILSEPTSTIPVIGASGAIAAVLGGYFVLYPKARVDVLIFLIFIIRILPVPAWIVLGVWFAIQVFGGVSGPSGSGGVAYWAHAGGFAAGVLMILPTFARLGGLAFWRLHHGHPPHPEAHYRLKQSSIPRVPRR